MGTRRTKKKTSKAKNKRDDVVDQFFKDRADAIRRRKRNPLPPPKKGKR